MDEDNFFNGYQAFLFDMDGTLVNSEALKGLALSLACKDYGATIDFNIYKAVMGKPWAAVTGHFFAHARIQPDLSQFNTRFRPHYERLLEKDLTLNPGVPEYLEQIKSRGKKSAVVSSAPAWTVEKILAKFNLQHVFDIIIAREDVTRHKPDPEAYLIAMDRLSVPPEQVLIFEDSTAGIEAGVSSGCDVVAVRHGFNAMNDFSLSKKVITCFTEMF